MDGQAVRNEIEYLTRRNLLMAEELKEYEFRSAHRHHRHGHRNTKEKRY